MDEAVIRELIGRKIVGKTRRDLDDISSRTFIPLVRCRRQFDNLCEVLRGVEESMDDLYGMVRKNFLLPRSLCHSYTAIIFLNFHQVKVKDHDALQDMPLGVALDCTRAFISYWTSNGKSLLLNPRLLQVIRDLYSACTELRSEDFLPVINTFKRPNFERSTVELHSIVLDVLRIGSGLSQSRKLQNILIDLISSIANPLQTNLGFVCSQLEDLFNSILIVLIDKCRTFFLDGPETVELVKRFFKGVKSCLRLIISDLEPKRIATA